MKNNIWKNFPPVHDWINEHALSFTVESAEIYGYEVSFVSHWAIWWLESQLCSMGAPKSSLVTWLRHLYPFILVFSPKEIDASHPNVCGKWGYNLGGQQYKDGRKHHSRQAETQHIVVKTNFPFYPAARLSRLQRWPWFLLDFSFVKKNPYMAGAWL